jgi:hypothetical protein
MLCDALDEDNMKMYFDFISNNVSRSNKKIAILMAGLPGSGKTGTREVFIQDINMDKTNFILLDVDNILGKYYNNNNSCYASAYKIWEYCINKSIEGGYDFIIEGTGKDLFKRIETLKTFMYKVYLCINLVTTETAHSRTITRALETGRSVTPAYITSTHALLLGNIPKYVNSDLVDFVAIYTNEEHNSNRIQKCFGKEVCKNQIDEILSIVRGGFNQKSKRNNNKKSFKKHRRKTIKRKTIKRKSK